MDDPADGGNEMQRAMAERAREFAAGQEGHRPRRHWQSAVGFVLAALVVGVVFFGFDAFLSSMQRLIELMGDKPAPVEPLPVFMVPESPPAP